MYQPVTHVYARGVCFVFILLFLDPVQVIQLQGDHRVKVSAFLIGEGIVNKDQVKLHGF